MALMQKNKLRILVVEMIITDSNRAAFKENLK